MPQNNDDIDASEISSLVTQSSAQLQQVHVALDKMNSQLSRMQDLFGKVRDYTQDEIRELNNYKSSVKQVADEYRALHAEQTKGMNDYSVALKAAEDRLQNLAETEKKAIEENTKLRERVGKIQANLDGRVSGQKKKSLQELFGMETASSKELRKRAADELTFSEKKIQKNRELIRQTQMEKDEAKKRLADAEKLSKLGQERVESERRRRGYGGTSALEVASDLNLPGVSQAAMIAKYARRGVESSGGEDIGGFAGLAARGLGGLRGGLIGGSIAAGGYTMLQGYRAYQTAHQMAPMARTLAGQMGAGEALQGRRQAIQAQGGYGGVENLQTLMQLNRQLGGQAGAGALRPVTQMANQFGLAREEVGAQAGALMMAGGATPQRSVQDLKSIMIEGVRGGMDRARITEFTNRIIGIQESIFEATGESRPQAIAEAMGQLMRASGRGEQFMRGPEMQAMRGIDQAIKQASRGGGQGAGTLLRAFGFGAGGQGGALGSDYYKARRAMEGGLFGQEEGSVNTMGRVFKQYDVESGGNKEISTLRMADEMGLGIRQVEQLREILGKVERGELSKEQGQKAVSKIQEESKDPLLALRDISAKMDENMARMAGEQGIGAVVKIDSMLLDVQTEALQWLQKIATLIDPDAKNKGAAAGDLAGAIGGIAAAAMGLKALGGLIKGGAGAAGGTAGGAGGMMGGLARGAGAVAKRVPLVAGAAAAAGGAMNVYDMYTHPGGTEGFNKDFEERTKEYGAMDWLMHPGDALTRAGQKIGEGVGGMMLDPETKRMMEKEKAMGLSPTSPPSARGGATMPAGAGAGAGMGRPSADPQMNENNQYLKQIVENTRPIKSMRPEMGPKSPPKGMVR